MQHFPLTTSPFLGRSREIEELGALLDDPSCRLLTLVGPGGIGKTRLAVEVATHKRAVFPDGLFFVALAPLNRPDDLLTAIAEAMPFLFRRINLAHTSSFSSICARKMPNVCSLSWIMPSIF